MLLFLGHVSGGGCWSRPSDSRASTERVTAITKPPKMRGRLRPGSRDNKPVLEMEGRPPCRPFHGSTLNEGSASNRLSRTRSIWNHRDTKFTEQQRSERRPARLRALRTIDLCHRVEPEVRSESTESAPGKTSAVARQPLRIVRDLSVSLALICHGEEAKRRGHPAGFQMDCRAVPRSGTAHNDRLITNRMMACPAGTAPA